MFASAGSQYISVPPIVALGGVAKASLSAWFRKNTTSDAIEFGQDGGSGSTRFSVIAYSDGQVYVSTENASSGSGAFGWFAENDTAWHQIVVAFDGTQSTNAARLVVYVDGTAETLAFQGTIPPSLAASASTFYLGRAPSDSIYTDGSLDEVRLATGVARSADWVATEYANQSSPPSVGTFGSPSHRGRLIGFGR